MILTHQEIDYEVTYISPLPLHKRLVKKETCYDILKFCCDNRWPATADHPHLNNSIRCGKGRKRSFTALYNICKTYLPEITVEEFTEDCHKFMTIHNLWWWYCCTQYRFVLIKISFEDSQKYKNVSYKSEGYPYRILITKHSSDNIDYKKGDGWYDFRRNAHINPKPRRIFEHYEAYFGKEVKKAETVEKPKEIKRRVTKQDNLDYEEVQSDTLVHRITL